MNKHTATKTAPVTQKVKIIVSSIFPQLEATGVHHQGLQKWKIIDPIIIKQILSLQTLKHLPYKYMFIFTTFIVLKQLSKTIMVFFSTKTISHFGW
tara:strand:- start:447 stop:734 length:288 start_codon:yes stop_codon:yes gene_type:complete